MIPVLLATFFTSLLLAQITIPIVISVANKNSFVDVPNERASHSTNIPTIGGVSIYISLLFTIIFWVNEMFVASSSLQFILSAFTIVFFVGLVDDLIHLKPMKKMVGQLLAIGIIVFLADIRITSMYGVLMIHELPYIASVALSMFTMVVITNAYNLIDGIDGLAGGVGVIASFTFALVAYFSGNTDIAIISVVLMGALIGFLRFNIYPAKIFMGDTGSLLVGFVLSILAIQLIENNSIDVLIGKGPLMAIAILIVPLIDTLRVFTLRISKGSSPFKADRNHIHHNLLDIGFGHLRTMAIICFGNIVLIWTAWMVKDLGNNLGLLIIVSIALLFIFFISQIRKNKLKEIDE